MVNVQSTLKRVSEGIQIKESVSNRILTPGQTRGSHPDNQEEEEEEKNKATVFTLKIMRLTKPKSD